MPYVSTNLYSDETVTDIHQSLRTILKSLETLTPDEYNYLGACLEHYSGDIVTALLSVRNIIGVYDTPESYTWHNLDQTFIGDATYENLKGSGLINVANARNSLIKDGYIFIPYNDKVLVVKPH